MKTIMEQMEQIQNLTNDLVVKASELNEASSKMVYQVSDQIDIDIKSTREEAIADQEEKELHEENCAINENKECNC